MTPEDVIHGDHSFSDLMEPEAVILVNRDLQITYINKAAQTMLGCNAWDAVARDCRPFFENWTEIASSVSESLQNGLSFEHLAVKLNCAENESLEAVTSISPVQLSGGDIQGVMLILHSAERLLPLYKSLQEKTRELINERNKLEAIFNSSLEGTLTIDKHCVVTTFNRSAEKITGFDRSNAVGQKCWDIFRSNYCRESCPNGGGEPALLHEKSPSIKEIYITRRDGRRVPVRVTSAPLMDAEGNHIGAVETFQDMTELENLSRHLEDRFQLRHIIGKSRSMERVYRLIEDVSKSNSTVLITGESGTGKELVARAIHLNSHRRSGSFLAINCSAFAETLLESELFGHEKGAFTGAMQTKQGRFEMAQGGTLFLDEIGDISQAVQVKLLRVLETRQFERVGGTKPIKMDVRLIAATNKNLADEVTEGRIRDDFYYRINVINIHLPPLCERKDDLPLLIQNFIEKQAAKFKKRISGISTSALKLLKAYDWPGNIRELENVIEHAFVMCHSELIDTDHLPERFLVSSSLPETESEVLQADSPIKHAEKSIIAATLKRYGGHRGKTAAALGIDKTTLWRKMKKLELI